MEVKIKEQSWLAQLAARKMKAHGVAIVWGRTIHLWNISRTEFFAQPTLVAHEMEHVQQYKRYGFLPFLFLYLLQWMRNGYYNNRFETEARAAEEKPVDLTNVEFL